MERFVKSVFFGIALLYVSMMVYQLGIVVHFKIHQEEIIKEYCVNKDKPEMHCDGHCHLQQELKEVSTPLPVDEEADIKTERTNLSLSFFLGYQQVNYLQSFTCDDYVVILDSVTTNDQTISYHASIWHPPCS